MSLNRTRLYTLLAVACLAGYSWLYISFTFNSAATRSFDVCLVKHITNIPCPSCGSTRSVLALMNGHLMEALHINPLGYLIAIIMLVAPLWIIADMLGKSKSLFDFYHAIEARLRQPAYAIPLVVLILFNWFWNIKKGI